jgi:hypothetical protein
MIAADKFADKSLTSRRFEGGQDAQREGKHVDLPELDVAGQSQHREQRGLHHFKREDHHEEGSLWHAIGDNSAKERQERDRQRL